MLALWSTYLTGIFLENARIADANDSKYLERLGIAAEQELIQKRGGLTLVGKIRTMGMLRVISIQHSVILRLRFLLELLMM